MEQSPHYTGNAQHFPGHVDSHPTQIRRLQHAGRIATGSRDMKELPIYKLLQAFNLQQYTIKLAESGYGDEVYKLALLSHT